MSTNTSTNTDAKYRTITLTDRPPVRIREDQWPVEASATFHDYEGQYDFQSFRNWRGWLTVRLHADGRRIVYARYAYETAYQGERDSEVRSGVLLDASASGDDVIRAIHRVNSIRPDWCRNDLAAECIADLPTEEL